MLDKLTTVPRARMGRKIGSLDDADLIRMNRGLLVFLGLAG
jgi:mRNA interferase MazF